MAMGFAATMIFYHAIGLGVATAVFLSDSREGRLLPVFRLATAVVFWPLYLPILLAKPRLASKPEPASPLSAGDTMSQAIAQVEAELETALASLDGWVEDVLAHENVRFHELSNAWRAQAARIREMDRLLARTEPASHELPHATHLETTDRWRQSEQSRRTNLARLRQVRTRAHDELMGTLAWVRELVSMIHLAKFTGAPASRAEELVAQIAAAIEGISAVTWQDAAHDSSGGPSNEANPAPIQTEPETLPCNYSSASATSSPQI
jgi:hypothetical protein